MTKNRDTSYHVIKDNSVHKWRRLLMLRLIMKLIHCSNQIYAWHGRFGKNDTVLSNCTIKITVFYWGAN